MLNDDHPTGRLLGRRELVALFGASAVASLVHRAGAQAPPSSPRTIPDCVVQPQQTEGPYFVDERLLRSDIRQDPATGIARPGAPLELRLTMTSVAADGSCTALPGAQVDLWQCDAMGLYSDVRDRHADTTGQKFLRGHQITDADGLVRFTTIYPGWYPGRAVHIHFKVRSAASTTQASEFTSQFYFDESITDRVHALAPYSAHTGQRMRNDRDGIFRNGGPQLTLPVSRTPSGYSASFTIGMRPGEAPPDGGRRGRRGG